MFKIVKKILGITGVFRFARAQNDVDKDLITGCVMYLLSIVAFTGLIFIFGVLFYI